MLCKWLSKRTGTSRAQTVNGFKQHRALVPTLLSVIAYSLVTATNCLAQDKPMTAGDLQQICTGSDARNQSACRFYILGVTQGIEVGMNIADGKTRGGRPCVPSNTDGAALEFAVKKMLGEDLMIFPKDRELDASGFIGAAIIKTFPCRKAN